jgi:hypothetical protein
LVFLVFLARASKSATFFSDGETGYCWCCGAGLAVLIQQYQRFSLATFKARQTTTDATILF